MARATAVMQLIRSAPSADGCGANDRDLLRRFADENDQAAFAALVRRHGGMVLGVCRRALSNLHDAEDACQATFLVLARKAKGTRWQPSVANWLFATARKVARNDRVGAQRRARREVRAAVPEAVPPVDRMTGAELLAALDEELDRLPPWYREPLVLCYLEGLTRDEAALRLGVPAATLKTRLERGRKRLGDALARRGWAPGAGLLALAATSPAGAAPPRLVERVLAAARGSPRAAVAALAEEVAVNGLVNKSVLLVLSLAGAAALGIGLGSGPPRVAGQRPDTRPPAKVDRPPASPSKEETAEVTVSGRVLDPGGKPVAGAKVFFARYILAGRDKPPLPATVTSDAEGRFRLRVSRTGHQADHEKARWMRGAVVALAPGFGHSWVGADNAEALTNVTVKLVKDVPIEGRVVDLQGRPIAGASVQVRSVGFRQDGGDLKGFVDALRAGQWPFGPLWPGTRVGPALLGLTRPAVTGADGKFRLNGISGECLVGLRFAGPTIETTDVFALTRPGPTIRVPPKKDDLRPRTFVFHGSTFDHAAAPTRPIEGAVRDKDTGKPIAGVTIRARLSATLGPVDSNPYLDATTDAEGRYRLVGLSRESGHRLMVLPGPGQPYLPATRTLRAAPGLGPVTADFGLKRGVLIRGRVTDRETGRPVAALVRYGAFVDNPEARALRDCEYIEVRTADDGSFTLLGLPGRGLLAAKAADLEQEGRYVMAAGADRIKGPLFGEDNYNTEPSAIDPREFNTLAEINPAGGAGSVVRDLVLDPGKTVTGTFVDPDGKPVKGVSIDNVRGVWFNVKDLPTAQFRIPGFDPKHPRAFFFHHHGKNLGAAAIFKGDEPMPVTVRLQKCATVTGRLVDDDGLPRGGWITGHVHRGQLTIKDVGRGFGMQGIGKDGRFRMEGVIPGLRIGIMAGKNTSIFDTLVPELTLKPGEVRDLGDVKVKPGE